MPVRGDARSLETASAYAVGERVFGAIDSCPGDVVSVDRARGTFTVEWLDASGSGVSVVYPEDTVMVREAWPWER